MARIVVHGHFYQPPRENPWTGDIDVQPSAAPFRDWNERVHAECYLNMVFADLQGPGGELVVNNFERISFNVGPTLASWMERLHPRTYARILKADRKSVERLGRGNAIAQSFHHTILPLSEERDARTEVRWGLADFRHRFGREPEGMWLPETAVNDDVLGVLVDEGVRFTILAPHQAARSRPFLPLPGKWSSDPIDTRLAYRWIHPDGSERSLTLFFYDGEIAQNIAFGNPMASGSDFLDLFESRSEAEQHVVHAATDGETYGHHQTFGEIGLAYALFVAAEERDTEITNYAAYLERFAATHEVEIAGGEGTSWSCSHGVGRWKENCGCSTRAGEGWNQEWRAPLREAMTVVKAAADEMYERLGAGQLANPWAARDRYVDVVVGKRSLDEFLIDEAAGDDRQRAATLLELQRNAMAMFTSCGWFFADIADIETVQILRYAARTLELMEELGETAPYKEFLRVLEQAKSNDPEQGTGADVFRSIRH
jgi:alpha-amylase/alpha-mannosidase (GH57 family)